MTTQELVQKIKDVMNNEKVNNAFYSLYERWLDERQYEDVNEYGKFLVSIINDNFPETETQLLTSTKRPFGVKTTFCSRNIHFLISRRGNTARLEAKSF